MKNKITLYVSFLAAVLLFGACLKDNVGDYWPDGVKDINDAVVKLGRLAAMWLIVSAKESNGLKIQLRAKKWFKEE